MGRHRRSPLTGGSSNFCLRPLLGDTRMPMDCVILAGGGSAELRSWKAFGQWVNIIRKASPKTTILEHALYAAHKIVGFIQGITSSEERSSVVEESSSLVLSLHSREGDCGTSQSLSERVRRLSERALQNGLGKQQTGAAQMAEPSTERRCWSCSPMVRQRRCTLRFFGHQRQSVSFHCRSAVCSEALCPRMETWMELR